MKYWLFIFGSFREAYKLIIQDFRLIQTNYEKDESIYIVIPIADMATNKNDTIG